MECEEILNPGRGIWNVHVPTVGGDGQVVALL